MEDERTRGRPRSERARRAVLDAAAALLAESGYERLTIEAIAERAAVSRQTVYRWWRSKAAIVAEAVLEGAIVIPSGALPDSGDLRTDLRAWYAGLAEWLGQPDSAALVRALVSANAQDGEDARELYDRITRPDHAAVVARLESAVAAGQVRSGADLEAAADMLLGAALYRVLARLPSGAQRAEAVADLVLAGLSG